MLVDKKNIDITVFASKIHKTTATIYDIYKKEDINTSLLREISNVLDVPITYWFEDNPESYLKKNPIKQSLVNDKNIGYSDCSNCKLLEDKLEILQSRIEDKEKIIAGLERELGVQQQKTKAG